MMGIMLENFGRLVEGVEYAIQDFGWDWARIGRMIVPLDFIDLPAMPGSERAENISLGLIRPRVYKPMARRRAHQE
jgi:hypothetical protein